MAGQALHDFLTNGVPDDAFIMTYSQDGALAEDVELADVIVGIAPFTLVIEKCTFRPVVDADGACAAHIKAIPSATGLDQAGTALTTAVDVNASGNDTNVDFPVITTANVVPAGSAIVLDLADATTAMTRPHVTVFCTPYNGGH
jgi:hypothetical protein